MLKNFLKRPSITNHSVSPPNPQKVLQVAKAVANSTPVGPLKVSTDQLFMDTVELVSTNSIKMASNIGLILTTAEPIHSDYINKVRSLYWNPLSLLIDPSARPAPRIAIASITASENSVITGSTNPQIPFLQSLFSSLGMNQSLEYALQSIWTQVNPLPDNNLARFALAQIQNQSKDFLGFSNLVTNLTNHYVNDFTTLGSNLVSSIFTGSPDSLKSSLTSIGGYLSNLTDFSAITHTNFLGAWNKTAGDLRRVNGSIFTQVSKQSLDQANILALAQKYPTIGDLITSDFHQGLNPMLSNMMTSNLQSQSLEMFKKVETALVDQYVYKTQFSELSLDSYNKMIDKISLKSLDLSTSDIQEKISSLPNLDLSSVTNYVQNQFHF